TAEQPSGRQFLLTSRVEPRLLGRVAGGRTPAPLAEPHLQVHSGTRAAATAAMGASPMHSIPGNSRPMSESIGARNPLEITRHVGPLSPLSASATAGPIRDTRPLRPFVPGA